MDKFNLTDWVDSIKCAEDAYFTDLPYSDDFFLMTLVNNKKYTYPVDTWKRPDIIDKKVTVTNPDGSKTTFIETVCDWDKFDRLFENNHIPMSITDFGYFVLRNSSKLTDIILSSDASTFLSDSFLLSSKTKAIISVCNAGQTGFYPTAVELKGSIDSNYYLFKYSATATDYIDYHKSTFYSQNDLLDFGSRKIIDLNSVKEIDDFSIANNKYVFAKKIVFTSDFPDFDIFRLTDFGLNQVIISKRLALEIKYLSGFILERTHRL